MLQTYITKTKVSLRQITRLVCLLFFINLSVSCGDNERIDLKPVLINKDWEQEVGIIEGNFYGPKQIYKLSFKADNSVDIVVDYFGVSGDSVILNSYKTIYDFNASDNTILFPEPIDTLNWLGEIIIRLPKVKIVELRSDKLVTEAMDSKVNNSLLWGKFHFRPMK